MTHSSTAMKKRYIAQVADQSAVAPGSGLASGVAMTKLMACLVLILGFGGSAHADVVYVWKTLSATIDGAPTSLTASGEITLTDAGFSRGFGSVTTTLVPGGGSIASQVLDGIKSASFQMFDGPNYTTGGFSLVNLIATVAGPNLNVVANEYQSLYGGFFMDAEDTADYFLSGTSIYFGTDNQDSPCYGPETPGQSYCVVTGVFEQVVPEPEPATLPLSLAALCLFTIAAGRARRS